MKVSRVLLILISVVSLVGCSGGDISGTYSYEGKPDNTLRLTKDGKFLLRHRGDAGDYSVEGKKILVTVPMFGGAEGSIDGNKLVFPKTKDGGDLVGHAFEGAWVKQ